MIKVLVPATSANWGPGFDALGIALGLYNTFTFRLSEEGHVPQEKTLVHEAFQRVYGYLGKEAPPVDVEIFADIPLSRGLGSSAACIVGGVMGANRLLGSPLSKEELLKISTEMEGHPDNVAPALFGGLVASVKEGTRVTHGQIPMKKPYDFMALIPDFTLSTKEARKVLPKMIPFSSATENIGRLSLLLAGLTSGEDVLIKSGMKDVLHEPYRGPLIKGFEEIREKAYEKGAIGCYLSGAGPTIMVLTGEGETLVQEAIADYLKKNHPSWSALVLKADPHGARWIS